VGSLPAVLSALRTRDRLAVTVVSYLLATVAAVGSVAAVARRAAAPATDALDLAPASADND